VIGLALALATTAVVMGVVALTRPPGEAPRLRIGEPAPAIEASGLDGSAVSLASLRGRPVVVNFWGPSCVPCRNEFPLFISKLAEHDGDGLAIVGVLMGDPPEPARDFIAELGATWPSVDDPEGSLRTSYRTVARPTTYFIDASGVVRAIQVGETTDALFEASYAKIAP
jgi:cytochrome c biogenesis protein CcmG/thiol:disulfide interchange protein DsbE